MKEKVTFDVQEVYKILAGKLASLEIQLAAEQVAKEAIVKYAEELEYKLKEEDPEVK
ncbi:hypothetical protein HXA31_03135 [Salipaludibacillus agaradhaerens]|jgi:hypothetical protein|uniref:Uncharacterized protein n=1 Tax=Salipaludibacillus agaradhaerens TaxID=76935 RepID=A0A9Q4B2I0_SALAG|nr:hypothetical protein [Salipaludibacillus agaradhaerens]MCR6097168.1 hypothetical protein [Salipaludibacillus agaradhaerens]MCR6113347.1 hypothetical protein [Salipaludibacillus agaradhaerens]